jgi:NAD(P)H-flavin reductase
MYRGVLERLLGRNIPANHIFLSLERRMRCGLGKCGHCQMDGFYTCQSGPVYRYSDIMGIEEAL